MVLLQRTTCGPGRWFIPRKAPVVRGVIIELYAQGSGLQASIVMTKLSVEIKIGVFCPKALKSRVAFIFTV